MYLGYTGTVFFSLLEGLRIFSSRSELCRCWGKRKLVCLVSFYYTRYLMFSLYFVSFSYLILPWMQLFTKAATSIPASSVQLVLEIIHHAPTFVQNFVIYVVLSLSRDDFTFAVPNSSVSFYSFP